MVRYSTVPRSPPVSAALLLAAMHTDSMNGDYYATMGLDFFANLDVGRGQDNKGLTAQGLHTCRTRVILHPAQDCPCVGLRNEFHGLLHQRGGQPRTTWPQFQYGIEIIGIPRGEPTEYRSIFSCCGLKIKLTQGRGPRKALLHTERNPLG